MQVRPRCVFLRPIPVPAERRLAEERGFGRLSFRRHCHQDARARWELERFCGAEIAVGVDFGVEDPVHGMSLQELELRHLTSGISGERSESAACRGWAAPRALEPPPVKGSFGVVPEQVEAVAFTRTE